MGFLSQRRCRAKVNSLKYNVIRDAFNCSCYSYASWQQTYTGRKHANKTIKRKYTTTNFKTKSSLHEAESFNYSNISSKDLDFNHRNWIIVHVCPRSEECQVLLWKPATQWPSHIFASVSLWFQMPTAWSSASEIYIIIQNLHHPPVILFGSWKNVPYLVSTITIHMSMQHMIN